jgi:uncharacterized protein
MKTLLFAIALSSFLVNNVLAQEIIGQWNGVLSVNAKVKIRVVFNISENSDGLKANMDSPDQKAFGIPVDETTFEDPKLRLLIKSAGIEYTGELTGDSIVGTFRQAGQAFEMNLKKELIELPEQTRVQDPKKPYPYRSEDLKFRNEEANISLAGTLTMPKRKGKFPAVILITGSGPQDRNEELLGHKPFLVLSDHLTRNGFAVLRFDDRGIGESEGDFSQATSFDFASDVHAAVKYLQKRKEIDAKKIGLLGHSEGGIIAPIVATNHPNDISFIVMFAGTGLPGYKIVLMQQELIGKASGVAQEELDKGISINAKIFDKINQVEDSVQLRTKLTQLLNEDFEKNSIETPENMTKEEFIAMQIDQVVSPWMLTFLRFDPATVLEKVKCPTLAVIGENDLQVPPKENLKAIKKAFEKGGNNKLTAKELPGLNHLFQECPTGAPSNYAEIEQTISPIALNEVSNWLKAQTK